MNNINPGDSIHLHSMKGIYQVEQIAEDAILITCNKWKLELSLRQRGSATKWVPLLDYKCHKGIDKRMLPPITQNISNTIYTHTMIDLRARMEQRCGSVQSFCQQHNMDHKNVYKIFSGNQGKEMSIGLFARISKALGNPVADSVSNSNLSLKEYLEIDNNAIWKTIFAINFGGAQK